MENMGRLLTIRECKGTSGNSGENNGWTSDMNMLKFKKCGRLIRLIKKYTIELEYIERREYNVR